MEAKFDLIREGNVIKITLTGKLDATNAPALMEALKAFVGETIDDIVFFAKDAEYISSAGIRTIIFAKQKIGLDTKIYLINAQETVLDVIKMSGLDTVMIIQDTYE